MNHLGILVLLLVPTILSSSFAAEPVASIHWYHIVIATGSSTTAFTGSSPFDADELSAQLTKTKPVVLENRRQQFAQPSKRLEYGWHPDDEAKVFIVPRAILYFVELSGDPAAPLK